MPESGHTWRRAFKASPAEARALRRWAAGRANHPHAATVANELFVALLATRPDVIEMTVSTAGRRIRLTATAPAHPVLRLTRGRAKALVTALTLAHGISDDRCALWAELVQPGGNCQDDGQMYGRQL